MKWFSLLKQIGCTIFAVTLHRNVITREARDDKPSHMPVHSCNEVHRSVGLALKLSGSRPEPRIQKRQCVKYIRMNRQWS